MRISDWSSDVCSSDLQRLTFRGIAVIDASQRIDALSPIRFGEILAAGSGELAQRSDTIAMLGQEVAPRADRSWAVVQGIDGGREHHFRAYGVKREFETHHHPKNTAPPLNAQIRSWFSPSPPRPNPPPPPPP